MTAYTNRLTDLARRNADERKARKESARTEAKMTPLEDRLRKLLERIPREEQVEGLSIHGLQTQLKGRKHNLAHVGEIGVALRKLGYKRCRVWGGDRPLGAVWRKPS